MPGSTYSSNLKIELMTTGENSGTWGDVTNTNLGTALEQAIIGYGNPDYTSDANLTITITNSNASQAARCLVLNVTSVFGSLTATRELIVPTSQKQYIVQNNTTGGQSITVKTSAGTGITVPNGRKAHLYVNGTDVIQMFDFVDINGGAIDGTPIGASSASTGAFTTLGATGNVTLGDADTDTITQAASYVTGTQLKSAKTATNTLSLAAYDVDGTAYTNLITLTASNTPTLALTSTGVGTINNMSIGATTASTGAFTTLTASSLTSGRVTYATTAGLLTDSANLLYSGTDLTVYGLTVGRGAGAVSTNTAVGASALAANTSGTNNAAFGTSALAANTSALYGTAIGAYALASNTTGNSNTGVGYGSLNVNTTGASNTALGFGSLQANTTASYNTAVGYQAGYANTTGRITAVGAGALLGNTTGTQNAAFGAFTLAANTTGSYNSAFGGYDGGLIPPMYYNTTGSYNVAMGNGALAQNTTASNNTAVGYQSLYSHTAGGNTNNTAVGRISLYSNTSGVQNTAVGNGALYTNSTANNNSAFGESALYYNTTGASNTAMGQGALQANTTASNNTAVGYQAGYSNTSGDVNSFFGRFAGYSNTTGLQNAFIGANTGYGVTTGSYNTFVSGMNPTGYAAGRFITTGSKNTIIGPFDGNAGGLDIRTASNYIVLSDGDGNPRLYVDNGPTLVCPAAYSVTSANAANMVVLSSGAIARSTSALKYKQDIRDLESIDINLLRGVRYKSKSEQDDQTKDHFGIVADEVDAAGIKELVSYGADGEVEGFQYDRLTVVLLKAIQELKAEVDSLKSQLNGASA